jgi:hypothetical protein
MLNPKLLLLLLVRTLLQVICQVPAAAARAAAAVTVAFAAADVNPACIPAAHLQAAVGVVLHLHIAELKGQWLLGC